MRKIISVIIVFFCWNYSAQAVQNCNTAIKNSTPTSQFKNNNDGTVTDIVTNLTWKRCPEGFSFDNGNTPTDITDDNCIESGMLLYSWKDAMLGAITLNVSGFGGKYNWRLPNIKELNSIVEVQCANPSINNTVFPSTNPCCWWWTSSPNLNDGSSAWVVDFGIGYGANDVLKTTLNYVRLVSDNF